MSSSNRVRAGWQIWLSIGSVAAAAFMAGCGGGGGSGDPVVTQTPMRVVSAGNAEAAVKLTLDMIDLTDVLVTSWGLGGGINETRCQSGSGIGTVDNCVIGANTFTGAVTPTISESKTLTIPGDTRLRDMPTKLSLSMSGLKWQSTKNFTTYSIAGNLTVNYTYPASILGLGTASVTGTLTLTDDATGIRYQYRSLTQRYSITVNSTTPEFVFAHSDHKGDIMFMDENKKYAMLPGTTFDYLTLTGSKSRLSLMTTLQGEYSMRIDSDNDGNFDTFATMPISELGKGHSVSRTPPTVSISRQGGNDVPVDKNVPAVLTANVADKETILLDQATGERTPPDYNFYQLSWAVTGKPDSAVKPNEPTIEGVAQTTSTQWFKGLVAGNYDVTLTVTEVGLTTAPLPSTATIRLVVGLNTPTIDVAGLEGATGTVNGQQVSFPITVGNVEGTVTTALLAGPAGMSVDNQTGQLTWTPKRQFFPGTSETVTLQVSNENRKTSKSFTVKTSDTGAQLPLVTPGVGINDFSVDASLVELDTDGTLDLLMAGSSSAFLGLKLTGSTPAAIMANPYVLHADAGSLIGVKPLRTNGVVSAYAVASSRGVFVVDAATFAVRASRGIAFNLTGDTSSRRFAVADVNADDTDEIIVLTRPTAGADPNQLLVLKQDLSVLVEGTAQTLGHQFLVGNVDADAGFEIVTGNGTIFNAATLAQKEAAAALAGGKAYVLADVDADGIKEIVEATATDITVVDVDTRTRTVIAASLGSLTNANLFALNADDSDANEELLIGLNNQLLVYSINGSTLTPDRTVGTLKTGVKVVEAVRGNVTGSNAGDELVFVSRSSNGALINVAPVGSLTLLVNGATSQLLPNGGFAAAQVRDPAAESNVFIASVLREGAAGRGLLQVDAGGTPVDAGFNISAATAVYAASADVDQNTLQDFVVSSKLANVTDVEIMSQRGGMGFASEATIQSGTPAPITLGNVASGDDLEMVYIERTGAFGNETLNLVVREVGGGEIGRKELQAGGLVVSAPVALAVANIDGDADPDIVLLDDTNLRVFEYAGGTLTQIAAATIGSTARALAIGNVDGDTMDEIAVTRGGTTNVITLFDNTIVNGVLKPLAETAIASPTSALSYYGASGERPLWLVGSGSNIVAIDAATLLTVWTSPALHGQVNSVDVLKSSGSDQLRTGTEGALYRSRP